MPRRVLRDRDDEESDAVIFCRLSVLDCDGIFEIVPPRVRVFINRSQNKVCYDFARFNSNINSARVEINQ